MNVRPPSVDELQTQLDAARRALYRRQVDDGALARVKLLETQLHQSTASHDAAAAPPTAELRPALAPSGSRAPAEGRAPTAAVRKLFTSSAIAVIALVIGLAAGLNAAQMSDQANPTPAPLAKPPDSVLETLQVAVAHNDGTLAPSDYFRWTPYTGSDSPTTSPLSYRGLRGPQRITASFPTRTTALAIYVACAEPGARWNVTSSNGNRGGGTCGALTAALLPLELPAQGGSTELSITLDKQATYSISVYRSN